MLKVLARLMVTTGVLPVCASADTTQTNTHAEKTAVPELLARAERGDAKAPFNLGQMYDTGQGVPQDSGQAVAWFRRAADQGFAEAQSSLGVMYYAGLGVPQDVVQAVAWWRKAADQGFAEAQSRLGIAYKLGRGVPQDDVQAHKWFNIAAARASGESQATYANARDAVAGRMTPEQLAEAPKLAQAWTKAFALRQK